jgi:hypothetical protein
MGFGQRRSGVLAVSDVPAAVARPELVEDFAKPRPGNGFPD